MVAIVSGNSLGLNLSKLAQEGGASAANLGRNGEQAYVNLANGNLVLQDQDDKLVGVGLDLLTVRTYNSQALLSGGEDGMAGNWRIGFYRSLHSLSGVLNTVGSSISRTDGDGATAIYRYDSASSSYLNSEGEDAHDSLSYDSAQGQWRWLEGSSRVSESYDWTGGFGKLLAQSDASGNRLSFSYNGNQLTRVTDQNGEASVLDYDATDTSLLRQIHSLKSDGSSVTRVRYGYDELKRLQSVTLDLSPEDNDVSDGKTYVTTYRYEQDSQRISSISQSDGSSVAFSYQEVGGSWRLSAVTQTVDGVARTSRYDYSGLQTRVTDPLGNVSTFTSDSEGRLTQAQLAGMQDAGGNSASIRYRYDSQGNLLQQTDALGNISKFDYDARGNLLKKTDALGNTVSRTFNAQNAVISETVFLASGASNRYATTRYAYDSNNRLRFVVSDQGRVTEYRYNSFGLLSSTLQFTASIYTGSGDLSESGMNTWLASADQVSVMRSDSSYDFRGQLAQVTRWAKLDTAGNGVLDGTEQVTRYVYDQAGKLLQTIAPGEQIEQTTYDGLGRELSRTNSLGELRSTSYDDAQHTTTVTLANGLITTQTYNAAGEVIATWQGEGNQTLSQARQWFDAAGQLRVAQAANGTKTLRLYDAAQRKIGEVDGSGALTEWVYDGNGKLTQTLRYAKAVNVDAIGDILATDVDLSQPAQRAKLDAALAITLGSLRPAASVDDEKNWQLYDAASRLEWQIDGVGRATQLIYDGAGNLLAKKQLATPIAVAQLGNGVGVKLNLAGNPTSVYLSEVPLVDGSAHTYLAIVRDDSGLPDAATPGGTVSFMLAKPCWAAPP